MRNTVTGNEPRFVMLIIIINFNTDKVDAIQSVTDRQTQRETDSHKMPFSCAMIQQGECRALLDITDKTHETLTVQSTEHLSSRFLYVIVGSVCLKCAIPPQIARLYHQTTAPLHCTSTSKSCHNKLISCHEGRSCNHQQTENWSQVNCTKDNNTAGVVLGNSRAVVNSNAYKQCNLAMVKKQKQVPA